MTSAQVGVLAQAGAGGGDDLEAVGHDVVGDAGGRQEPGRLAGAERAGHLPGADRGAGEPGREGFARDDECAGRGDEALVQAEDSDGRRVRLDVAGSEEGQLDGVAEEREQLLVAAPAPRLEVRARGRDGLQLLDEVVDGVGAGERHLRDRRPGAGLRLLREG